MSRVKRGVTARARHKKVLAKAKVIMVRVKTFIVLLNKQSQKQVNTLIVIVAREKDNFVRYGLCESMPRRVSSTFHTAV